MAGWCSGSILRLGRCDPGSNPGPALISFLFFFEISFGPLHVSGGFGSFEIKSVGVDLKMIVEERS